MTESLTVILSAVWSTTAQSVAKGFQRQDRYDVTVIGTGDEPPAETAGTHFVDIYHRVPSPTPANPTDYVDALISLTEQYNSDLVVPLREEMMPALARSRERFAPATLLVSTPATVQRCNDKAAMAEFLHEKGFETPRTVVPDSPAENAVADAELDYPIIAKPRRGISTSDVYELSGPAELPLVNRIGDPILQSKVSGDEFTVDTFSDKDGVLCAVPRERLTTSGGVSVHGRTVDRPALTRQVRKLVDELDIYGPANVQCFQTGGGFSILEVNPRFSGTLALTIAAGMNTPRMALELAAGDPITIPNTFDQITMCRYWDETFSPSSGDHNT